MHIQDMIFEKLAYEKLSGYWKVNNRQFFNKIDCLKYASEIKNYAVSYHYFESTYSSLDWTKEPAYSLDELYCRRAQQLRDKYDYLMLAFSGGADSTNVLDTFLENNIHLDEIVTYYPIKVIEKLLPSFNTNNRSPENYIFEYVMAAQPKLKAVSAKYPNIKITIIDPTDFALNTILSNNAQTVLSKHGHTLSVVNAGEAILCRTLKEYSEKYNNVCCIFGVDRPSIRWHPVNNAIGFCTTDFNNNKGKYVIDGFIPKIEPFYHTPDMPEIFHAQAHVINKYLIPHFLGKHKNPEIEKITNPTMVKTPTLRIDQHTDFIKKILYKNFNPTIYQVDKPTDLFVGHGGYDGWFHHTDLIDKRTKDFFHGQHTEWLDNLDDRFIFKNENGIPIRLMPFVSKIFWFNFPI